jgi:hypothetical protein
MHHSERRFRCGDSWFSPRSICRSSGSVGSLSAGFNVLPFARAAPLLMRPLQFLLGIEILAGILGVDALLDDALLLIMRCLACHAGLSHG